MIPEDLRLVVRRHRRRPRRRPSSSAGRTAFALVAILCVLEISLSFDNAVVNATVLERMSAFWQKIFLTVGILIAVFGMRLVFPLLIVGITAKLGPIEAVRLALEGGSIDEPGTYALPAARGAPEHRRVRRHVPADALPRLHLRGPRHHLADLARAPAGQDRQARPALGRGRAGRARDRGRRSCCAEDAGHASWSSGVARHHHLPPGQRPRRAASRPRPSTTRTRTSGIHGSRAVDADAGEHARQPAHVVAVAGKAAFFLFLYLEVLDASFSFDGVIGAFAITQDIDHHRARPRRRRDVHPVAHGLPGPQGHPERVRVPRARRALGDRRPGGDPAGRASSTRCPRSSPA